MTRITLLILLFLFSQIVFAQEGEPPEPGNDAEKVQPTREKNQQNPTTWPHPFAPSQDVGADSQVSFPTDI